MTRGVMWKVHPSRSLRGSPSSMQARTNSSPSLRCRHAAPGFFIDLTHDGGHRILSHDRDIRAVIASAVEELPDHVGCQGIACALLLSLGFTLGSRRLRC